MPPGSAPIRGAEAIQKFWQGAFDSGVGAVGHADGQWKLLRDMFSTNVPPPKK